MEKDRFYICGGDVLRWVCDCGASNTNAQTFCKVCKWHREKHEKRE